MGAANGCAAGVVGADQIDTPYGLDDLVNSAAAHPGVDLDDTGSLGRAFALDMEDASAKAELPDGLHAQFDEPADRSGVVVRRAMQACLLKRWLHSGPVLGDAGERALALVQDQVEQNARHALA